MAAFPQGERHGLDGIHSPSTTLCSGSPALVPGHGMPILPRLQIDSLDTSPFSEYFSGLIRDELVDHPPALENVEQSYVIERFINAKELDSEWEDEDIDEILVMSPKLLGRLPTIAEELYSEVDSDTQRVAMSDFELLEPTPHLCRKRDTGRIFVLKTFNTRNRYDASEQTILGMLKALDAPFLPHVYWSFRDENNYHMVMEYYPRHNLSSQLARYGALSPAHTLFYACEIAEAVSALHATGIVHRNLNPENVMIDSDGHIILSGLEYAKIVEQSGKVREVFEATPEAKGYHAPELLLGWAHDFAVDCWGYGLLLHFMLSHINPLRVGGEDHTSLQRKIIHDPINLHTILEPPVRDLITKCLERNPAVRLSINAMGKHPYFAAVDWDNVAAKRIKVPCLSETNLNKNSSVSMHNLRNGYQDSDVSLGTPSGNREPRKVLSTNDLDKFSPFSSKKAAAASSKPGNAQALPPIFRMSSLLDDLPESSNDLSGPKPTIETTMQSALTLNDLPPDNQAVEVNSRDRMALFWEMLDSERRSISSVLSLDYTDPMAVRPHKLRKTRSTIYPEQRVSTLSTLSLQDRLRKKWKPSSGLPLSREIQKPPGVHFSQDIKQIGSGIGFTYTMPVATLSKASICTTTPRSCHGMFHGRISGLGLRLRFGSSKTKAKGRRAPPSLTASRNQDDNDGSPTFMQDFGGSSWSLVSPAMLPSSHDVESPMLTTTSNSPISDAGPLTPEGVDYELPVLMENSGLEDNVAHEAKDGDLGTTLRLVTPLGIPPPQLKPDDGLVSVV